MDIKSKILLIRKLKNINERIVCKMISLDNISDECKREGDKLLSSIYKSNSEGMNEFRTEVLSLISWLENIMFNKEELEKYNWLNNLNKITSSLSPIQEDTQKAL
jgi:hypothetical protein